MSVEKATFALYRQIVNGKTAEPLAEAIDRLVLESKAEIACYHTCPCHPKDLCPSCEAREKIKSA